MIGVRHVPLRRLVRALDNGAWGSEPGGEAVERLCVRAADFDYSGLRVDPSRLPARSYSVQQVRRLSLLPGDLVLEKSGGGDQWPVGRAVLWNLDVAAVPTNFAARLRPAEEVDGRYLVYVAASLYGSGATARCIKQTTGIQNLDTDAWLQTPAPLWPRKRQRRIADFLDDQVARLDAAVAASGQAQALLEQRALSGVHDAVTAGGHHDRDLSPLPWAPDLPAHWRVAKLSLLARMGTGHTPSRSDPGLWVDTDIPWLTTNDVHRFRRDEIDVLKDPALSISRAGLANSAAVLHPAGTVALSRTASAGFSVITGKDMATSQDFVTWTCGPRLLPHYLLAVLRASRQDLLGRLAMGSTHKTIYFPDLESLRVPLPPLQEQERAVEAVQRVQQETRELRTEIGRLIDLLEERKRVLITACVTGEFDVSAASDRAGDAALAHVPPAGRVLAE